MNDPTKREHIIYGNTESSFPLPFFKYVRIPGNENGIGTDPNPLANNENCAGKIISGALMGRIISIYVFALKYYFHLHMLSSSRL